MGFAVSAIRLDAGAEERHDVGQAAVAAERHDVGDVRRRGGTARGHDGQPAGETDAEHTDPAVRRERPIGSDLHDGILERVGELRRDAVVQQVVDFGGDHRRAGDGQVAGELDQPRLVDAIGVHTAGQQHGPRAAGRRLVDPGPHRPAAALDADVATRERRVLERGNAIERWPMHPGHADHQRRGAHVRHGGPGAERQQHDEEKEDGPFPGQSHAGRQ